MEYLPSGSTCGAWSGRGDRCHQPHGKQVNLQAWKTQGSRFQNAKEDDGKTVYRHGSNEIVQNGQGQAETGGLQWKWRIEDTLKVTMWRFAWMRLLSLGHHHLEVGVSRPQAAGMDLRPEQERKRGQGRM